MRIKRIVKDLYGSQAEFARRAEVGTSTLSMVLSGRYSGNDGLRGRIEKVIREDHPDVDLSGAWGEEGGAEPEHEETLRQCVSALELLRSRLDGSNKAYLGIIIDNLKSIGG